MRRFIKFFLISYSLLSKFVFIYSQIENKDNNELEEIKEKIKENDNLYFSGVRDRLKEKQVKLIKIKEDQSSICQGEVIRCKEKYQNYNECYTQLPEIEINYTTEIIKENNEDSQFTKDQYNQILTFYTNYQNHFKKNINNAGDAIKHLKEDFKNLKNKNINFLEKKSKKTTKETENDDSTFNDVANNFGAMFSKSYIEISNILNENINKNNDEDDTEKIIQKKLDDLYNNKDKNKKEIILNSLDVCNNILSDFKNGYYRLNSTLGKSMKKYIEEKDDSIETEKITLNKNFQEKLLKEISPIKKEFKNSYLYLCDLMKKNYKMCDELENYCQSYQDYLQYEIDQIDDLLIYFEDEK